MAAGVRCALIRRERRALGGPGQFRLDDLQEASYGDGQAVELLLLQPDCGAAAGALHQDAEAALAGDADGLRAEAAGKAEVVLRIDHCLLAKQAKPSRLARIVSHPQSLAQCRTWLAQHCPGVPLEEVASNAIEVHLHNLRKKLGTGVIRNVRGVGYRIG